MALDTSKFVILPTLANNILNILILEWRHDVTCLKSFRNIFHALQLFYDGKTVAKTFAEHFYLFQFFLCNPVFWIFYWKVR